MTHSPADLPDPTPTPAQGGDRRIEASDEPFVFISYSRADMEPVQRIRKALLEAGIAVWMDDQIEPWARWDQDLKKKIETCTIFMPVITAGVIDRENGYLFKEWNFAWERYIRMNPLRTDTFFAPVKLGSWKANTNKDPLDHWLNKLQRAELPVTGATDGAEFENLKRKIIQVLERKGRPDANFLPASPRLLPHFTNVPLNIGVDVTANLALRWGLNRQRGGVVLIGGSYGRIFEALRDTELYLATLSSGLLPRRNWLCRSSLPPPQNGVGEWVTALAGKGDLTETEKCDLITGQTRLGVLIETSNIGPNSSMSDSIQSLARVEGLRPLIIVHSSAQASMNVWLRILQKAFPTPQSLPAEAAFVEQVVGIQHQMTRPEGCATHIWEEPLHGEALLDFCVNADPTNTNLKHSPFNELLFTVRKVLGERASTRAKSAKERGWPDITDVVSDIAGLKDCRAKIADLAIKLLSDSEILRQQALIKALTASGVEELELIAKRAAECSPNLIEAWLDGLPSEKLPTLHRNQCLLDPTAVLATLMRRALLLHDEKAAEVAAPWLENAPLDFQQAVKDIRNGNTKANGTFWETPPSDETLRWVAKLTIGDVCLDVPVDELGPVWLARPAFWGLILSRPLEPRLLHRLRVLPADMRAIFGLCTDEEWEDLTRSFALPLCREKRGISSINTISPTINP